MTLAGRVQPYSLFTDLDIHLFKEGRHFRLYEKLGSHDCSLKGKKGRYFALWAPNAKKIAVKGDFNDWDQESHELYCRKDGSGIWEGFIPGINAKERYKYHIASNYNDYRVDKLDPFAFRCEVPPDTAGITSDLEYGWKDKKWMEERRLKNSLDAPISIYEMHFGSWKKDNSGRFPNYKDMAVELAGYLKEMEFTHVEFMPLTEHPFYGSWGYQTSAYYCPTGRYGSPEELMYLIDILHKNGIGVIMDWVPSHFPDDVHGLIYFDGTHLYEHKDPKQGFHPDWKSYIFNYGRYEVQSFLISNALFWLDKYHIDGLRMDAVASMLYLDYGRKDGQWVPNAFGGRENLEAVNFLRKLNETIYEKYPDVVTIAEESTAWPMVSRPNYLGGLGFGMKWNMGWMHDTLGYVSTDPIYRKFHHNQLTFSLWYAFNENFVLPLSHDEVVYGKKSLISKMPGDDWQKFANLRLLYSYMFTHPGKKLLFMGGEFGQWEEWNHDSSLSWHLLENQSNSGLKRLVKELNGLYRRERAIFMGDFQKAGFEWIDARDQDKSVISFLRKSPGGKEHVLIVCNFTPLVRRNYRVGVPKGGYYDEIFNSDAKEYGGSGQGNLGGVESTPVQFHGKDHSLSLSLPPLSALIFKRSE